ncbi:MAG: HD domain-containing protein [Selenomonadaceae bacterium]|nr:HD domain-containing protein [Selenomonadaceae bacterium]
MTEAEFLRIIEENGGKLYIAGGFVRDELMGKNPHDKDYVITGFSEEKFSSLFSNKKTGAKFPVYRLSIDHVLSEVALARREKKSGEGYKGFIPKFTPDITIEEDLFRRDTTMNSIAKELPSGRIIDPFNGADDIKNKIIRATSEHFLEDPVRALRAARQAAEHDFTIEEHTLNMMRKCREELQNEPTERFLAEMMKALMGKKPSLFFRILDLTGLLEVTFKEIADLKGKTQPEKYHPEGDAFEHSMLILDKVAAKTESKKARFAALVHDLGKGRTPKEMLPHHYGHEKRGVAALNEMNGRITLPHDLKKSACFVIAEHMRATRMTKPGKIVSLLTGIKKCCLTLNDFKVVIEADSGELPIFLKYGEKIIEELERVKGTNAPENLKGEQIGKWILSEQIRVYKRTMRLFTG